MNKLAFLGVIILGLVLLVTHLFVTLIIGLGPTTIAASYDAMREMEAFAEETAVEFDKTVTGPIASETIECSKTITGPTIRFFLSGLRCMVSSARC